MDDTANVVLSTKLTEDYSVFLENICSLFDSLLEGRSFEISKLVACNNRILDTLEASFCIHLFLVKQHQKLQAEIIHTQKSIEEYDQQLKKTVIDLYETKKSLERAVYFGELDIQLMQKSYKSVDHEDLANYAQRIAVTTSAPHNWKISMPLGQFKPPNPQEDMMRAGLLFQKFEKVRDQVMKEAAPLHNNSDLQGSNVEIEGQEIEPSLDLLDLDLNPDLT